MLAFLVDKLKKGFKTEEGLLLRADAKKGRFAEEINLDIYLRKGNRESLLLHAKLFFGRGHYREWIEMFGLRKEVFGKPFFGSKLESLILDLFAPHTGRLFVEYFEDLETARELKLGVPPPLSRLGFELAKRGFTYVRDWYIPEGLMEGGHKLQGEKTNDLEVQRRRIERLRRELEVFLKGSGNEEVKTTALERFKILEGLWAQKFL